MALNAEAAIRQLSEAIRNRRVVPFCGAGVSKGAGLPTGQEFIESFGLGQLPWQKAATVLANQLSFVHKFNSTFGNGKLEPSNQHRLLAALDAPYYITTNYDLLLEKALEQMPGLADHKAIGVLRSSRDLSSVYSYRNLVIKLHGDIECDELLVFDASDYMNRWRSPTPVDTFMSHIFSTHIVLFIGYSLDDAHILSIIQDTMRLASPNLPPRYVLVSTLDEQLARYLDVINVTPIVVGESTESFEQAICSFLYRLWEQRVEFSTYTRIVEKAEQTPKELLMGAMLNRQRGDLQEAKRILDELYRRGLGEVGRLDLLPTFLYLNTSVYDKLEDWPGLMAIDKSYIPVIFSKLQAAVPESILRAIRSVYQGSMAIAGFRAGDYREAKNRVDDALQWTCTETAEPGLHVIYASWLTTRALILLARWREASDEKLILQSAMNDLEQAYEILERYGQPGSREESHHFGRYFGTLVFVKIAMFESNKKRLTKEDKEELQILAVKAHQPAESRTRFGQIAGRYCEAFCNYWLATRSNRSERVAYLERTEILIRELKTAIPEKQIAARLKVLMLEALVNNSNEKAAADLDRQINQLIENLNPNLRERFMKTERMPWLSLPLN